MSQPIPVRIVAPQPGNTASATTIDEAGIVRLVHGFYGAVRKDPALGPIFGREIVPERWPLHLEKMCAFWSSVLLRTGRYEGRPLPPHLRLAGLTDAHFQTWLDLFATAARAAFDGQGAQAAIAMAERIAHSFRLAIAFDRQADTTGVKPQSAAPNLVPDVAAP